MKDRGEVKIDYDEIIRDDDRYAAILFAIDGAEIWLPRSQIDVDEDNQTVTLPEWLAIERELV